MKNNKTGSSSFSRRGLLALIGTASSFSLMSSPSPSRSSNSIDPSASKFPTAVVNSSGSKVENIEDHVAGSKGENIEDHGAEPNPEDQSVAVAEQNLEALWDAAHTVGEGGTVYSPWNTYFVGHDGSGVSNYTKFGGREPAGISIVGVNPEKSTLGITKHSPDDQNCNLLIYEENYNHGDVTIQNLKLDGNYQNLGDLSDNGSGATGIVITGVEGKSLTLINSWIRGWYNNGVRARPIPTTARYCTFEENGIGNALSDDSNSGHHIADRVPSPYQSVFDHCEFLNASGQAINISDGDGDRKTTCCYVRGCGVSFHKVSAGDLIKIDHTYIQPWSQFLEDTLEDETDDLAFPLIGRRFIHRLSNNTEPTPTVHIDNVEVRKTIGEAIKTSRYPLKIQGDMLAIHDIGLPDNPHYNGNATFKTTDEADLLIDFDRVSVHDSNDSVLFNTSRGKGIIERLHHDNKKGIGQNSSISIQTNGYGSDPFSPDVITQDETGINALMQFL